MNLHLRMSFFFHELMPRACSSYPFQKSFGHKILQLNGFFLLHELMMCVFDRKKQVKQENSERMNVKSCEILMVLGP